jgi:hypothetical protein
LRDRAALGALLWPTGDADGQGYEAIETRAASAYEHWVGSEGLSFRGRDDADRLGDVLKFHWEAVAKDGEAFGVGLNFLVLAADGRIERDYTFVVDWGWALLCSQSRKGLSASEAGSGPADEFSVGLSVSNARVSVAG